MILVLREFYEMALEARLSGNLRSKDLGDLRDKKRNALLMHLIHFRSRFGRVLGSDKLPNPQLGLTITKEVVSRMEEAITDLLDTPLVKS
jgi:hypothetical protein